MTSVVGSRYREVKRVLSIFPFFFLILFLLFFYFFRRHVALSGEENVSCPIFLKRSSMAQFIPPPERGFNGSQRSTFPGVAWPPTPQNRLPRPGLRKNRVLKRLASDAFAHLPASHRKPAVRQPQSSRWDRTWSIRKSTTRSNDTGRDRDWKRAAERRWDQHISARKRFRKAAWEMHSHVS